VQRRLLSVLLAGSLIGVPAVALRFACVGKSCPAAAAPAPPVPFCPLPAELKSEIAAGFVDGRSPDVMGVPSRGGAVIGGTDPVPARLAWPAATPAPDTSVPIVFEGAGVHAGPLPAGTGLDQIAPTLASIMGFQRAHPDIRAGSAVPGVGRSAHPALVLIVAWAGIGSADLAGHLRQTPWLQGALRSGAGALRGVTGSVPTDPAATLTTMGTGGLPRQHGITGSFMRSNGAVLPAWGTGAPRSIIATLADDWSQSQPGASIGLVAPTIADRGLIGGNWYVGHGPVDLRIGSDPFATERALLHQGYGTDATTDILGIVLDGPVPQMDAETAALVNTASVATGGSVTVAMAGTGSLGPAPTAASPVPRTGTDVGSKIDAAIGAPGLVAGVAGGGVFLNNQVMGAHGLSTANISEAMSALRGTDGAPLFDSTFPGFAVQFGKYC
jgi:hypothetical protein